MKRSRDGVYFKARWRTCPWHRMTRRPDQLTTSQEFSTTSFGVLNMTAHTRSGAEKTCVCSRPKHFFLNLEMIFFFHGSWLSASPRRLHFLTALFLFHTGTDISFVNSETKLTVFDRLSSAFPSTHIFFGLLNQQKRTRLDLKVRLSVSASRRSVGCRTGTCPAV